MPQGVEPRPVNVLLLGRVSTVGEEFLREQPLSGTGGFKVRGDWGAMPAVIDTALRVADAAGVQVAIRSDTLNEARGYGRPAGV